MLIEVIIPRPAHPTPGSGPPDSTQRVPPYPSFMIRSNSISSPSSRMVSSTVFCAKPPNNKRVESAFGSHPTTITFFPCSTKPAVKFCVVVDFPIPPFP